MPSHLAPYWQHNFSYTAWILLHCAFQRKMVLFVCVHTLPYASFGSPWNISPVIRQCKFISFYIGLLGLNCITTIFILKWASVVTTWPHSPWNLLTGHWKWQIKNPLCTDPFSEMYFCPDVLQIRVLFLAESLQDQDWILIFNLFVTHVLNTFSGHAYPWRSVVQVLFD